MRTEAALALLLVAGVAEAWDVKQFTDDTGTRVTVAALEAVQGFNALGQQVVLTASCRGRRFWIDVHFGDSLGPGERVQVAYHFAPQVQAQTAYWRVSRDGDGVEVETPAPFARQLLYSPRLTVRVSFQDGGQNVAVFKLRGARRALHRVLAACR